MVVVANRNSVPVTINTLGGKTISFLRGPLRPGRLVALLRGCLPRHHRVVRRHGALRAAATRMLLKRDPLVVGVHRRLGAVTLAAGSILVRNRDNANHRAITGLLRRGDRLDGNPFIRIGTTGVAHAPSLRHDVVSTHDKYLYLSGPRRVPVRARR